MSDLIARAGGLSEEANANGIVFVRAQKVPAKFMRQYKKRNTLTKQVLLIFSLLVKLKLKVKSKKLQLAAPSFQTSYQKKFLSHH